MFIKVRVGSNMKNKEVVIDSNSTLKETLEANDIDYSRGNAHLDGATLNPGDLDKTFASFGIAERCSLIVVTKSDAA